MIDFIALNECKYCRHSGRRMAYACLGLDLDMSPIGRYIGCYYTTATLRGRQLIGEIKSLSICGQANIIIIDTTTTRRSERATGSCLSCLPYLAALVSHAVPSPSSSSSNNNIITTQLIVISKPSKPAHSPPLVCSMRGLIDSTLFIICSLRRKYYIISYFQFSVVESKRVELSQASAREPNENIC